MVYIINIKSVMESVVEEIQVVKKPKFQLNYKKEAFALFITVVASVLSAVGLYIFVYPANFAPSGIDGIAAMIQHLTGISAGIFTIVLNAPLLITAWFILKKRYVIYTIIFTALSSGLIILLEEVAVFSSWQYSVSTVGGDFNVLISAVFSGVILGVRTGIMLKISASTGGVDVAAGMIQKKMPYRDIEKIISLICYVIIGCSYFVYWDINCIFLAIIQMFVFERTVSAVLRDNRKAIEFKIITKDPLALRDDIILNLKHGATIVESKGMFNEDGNYMIFTVVNIRQVPEFMNIIRRHKDTFAYYSEAQGVKGNFRWAKDDIAR